MNPLKEQFLRKVDAASSQGQNVVVEGSAFVEESGDDGDVVVGDEGVWVRAKERQEKEGSEDEDPLVIDEEGTQGGEEVGEEVGEEQEEEQEGEEQEEEEQGEPEGEEDEQGSEGAGEEPEDIEIPSSSDEEWGVEVEAMSEAEKVQRRFDAKKARMDRINNEDRAELEEELKASGDTKMTKYQLSRKKAIDDRQNFYDFVDTLKPSQYADVDWGELLIF